MVKQKSALLLPFPTEKSTPKIEIQVAVARNHTLLSLVYRCTGDLHTVLFPTIPQFPLRQDNLWKHTCFEAFIRCDNVPFYWELNCSPNGNWNLYYFNDYRRMNSIEEKIPHIETQFEYKMEQEFIATITLDLAPILSAEKVLTLNLATIIENMNGEMGYFALAHPIHKPDFHLPECFTLQI